MRKTLTAALLAAACSAVSAQTFGVHLASVHAPHAPNMNEVNPGLYAITDAGWTAGFYRNTWRRTTVYGGRTFSVFGPLDATLGLASGYKRELVSTAPFCQDGVTYTKQWQGHDTHSVGLLAVLSLRVPMALPVQPRLSWAPGVLHLSIEGRF
jgi:hypothetical protein